MRDVVVLLSGGLDSSVVMGLAHEQERLACAVFVDYGQPALRQEWSAACMIAHYYKTECVNYAVRGEVALGDCMRIGFGAEGPRVVPGRNALLLSCAVSWASANGHKEVWYGAIKNDQDDYPDCTPKFIRAFDAMANFYGIKIKAPLETYVKGNVYHYALKLEVPIDKTWSCYEPANGKPCGKCNSCRLRDRAIEGLE